MLLIVFVDGTVIASKEMKKGTVREHSNEMS